MTGQTRKSRQMRLNNCVLNTPKWIQTAGNLRNNACKHREAAKPADAANAELENNGKIRQLHHNWRERFNNAPEYAQDGFHGSISSKCNAWCTSSS